ncbi:MAG: alpha amylase C-terminal domain-containing protein [Bacteroidales bacterium]|nr:alpha amylase C-terminal domain-containing protein [Bacteroidales bacterium]
MGANLIDGGATFRVWAPSAKFIYVVLNGVSGYVPNADDELVKNPQSGHWTGFIPNISDGTKYRFYVIGETGHFGDNGLGQEIDGEGFKRDPCARELEFDDWPNVDCIIRNPNSYPWHDEGYFPPKFHELIVYQLHFGVFFSCDAQGNDNRSHRVAKFLDAIDRVEYLADLGINAIQPLPIGEFAGCWGLGYSGVDIYSPEMDYCIKPIDLPFYLEKVNRILRQKNHEPLRIEDLVGQINQLKAFVDICHLFGIAVITDVVFNHAGGGLDKQSMDFFDFPKGANDCDNLYFTDQGWAGGRVFAYSKREVRDFLINNAVRFLLDYHMDGIRFDEVSVIDNKGGWSFCQDLTSTLRYIKPEAVLIAEYWNDHRWLGVWPPPSGMGFHMGYNDSVRDTVRELIRQAAGGSDAWVDIGQLRRALARPLNFPFAWQAYNCIENHDFVLDMDDHRKPRIPKLADWNNPRSWYARSRTRVAMGILLTVTGVPMLFMGQEFLEDKMWSDSPKKIENFIWWAGLNGDDHHMSDHHRFSRDLIWLRRNHPALTSEAINIFHIDEANRIAAVHRWVPNKGYDLVVVISLREQSFINREYRLGFPQSGHWQEVFNSDIYDNYFNNNAVGNYGGVWTEVIGLHGMAHSALISIPANGIMVFKLS